MNNQLVKRVRGPKDVGAVVLALAVAGLATDVSGSCVAPPPGLVGWWPGDGNAKDIQGTNNGALQGGATATAVGMVAQAFGFDGTNSYVQIPNSAALRPTNLTIEAWVRFSSLNSAGSGGSPAGDQYLVFKQNSQTWNFEGFDLSKTRVAGGDVFRFLVTSAAAQSAEIHSATLLTTGVWYHVAAVRGSNFTQLYVNGSLERQTNVTFAQNYGSLPLCFGTSGQSYWDHKLNGSLDEVSLYSRALSSNEIASIYAAGASGKCKAGSGPSIATQPQSQSVAVGSNALFTVAAAGAAPLSYQWEFDGGAIADATNTDLTLANVQPADGGGYTVVVTNSAGSVTSAVAVLTVVVPPTITAQPLSQTVTQGTSVTFTVGASGSTPLSYQWQFNHATIPGATASSYTLANVQATNAGIYAVMVSNTAGSATSSNATLAVIGPPGITTQPASQSVPVGANAGFSVMASGTPPLAYQWLLSNAAIMDATNASLTLTNVQMADAGEYSVVVTNPVGSATSAVAVLTVLLPPLITAQPQSLTNVAGTAATFGATATGSEPLSYQWQLNGANLADGGRISGARTNTLSVASVQPVDAGSYTLVVSNAVGVVPSQAATLTVISPPAITVPPVSQSVAAGSNASFSVTAAGTPPLSYQWLLNGTNLTDGGPFSGSASPTLLVLNVQATNAGGYSVVVTNVAGSVTSTVAALTVIVPGSCLPPPPGLAGWWPGDGNANDIAGLNNGTLQGGATANAAGMVAQAFSFDGTNNYVQIADAPALKPANLTVEAWVTFSGLNSALSGTAPAGDQYLVFKQNSRMYNFEGYSLEKYRVANGDAFMFTVGSASGQEVVLLSKTLVNTSVWYHVAAIRGSNFMQLYVNGKLEGQTNVGFAQDYGTLPLFFGTSHETYWDGKLKGRLDEVSLYNRALSSNEVAAIYTAGAAGKCKALSGPSITAQPQSLTNGVGATVSFSATAAGAAPLSYQWQFNGVNLANGGRLSGADTPTLIIVNVQPADAGGYALVVSNAAGVAASAVATLTVNGPPVITLQPASQSAVAGNTATFSVAAAGTAPLRYQWWFNSTKLSGATGTSLTLAGVQPANAGNYTVVVTNSLASVTSAVAVLTVLPAAGTLTVNGAKTYQVIDGFGVNANHRSWNNNELQPVLDALIDQAGMTLFHVIFDNNNWEATNDNSNANVMNWDYYNTVYSAPDFQKMWGIMAYLNQRGITNGLVPDFEGPVASWMGGLSLTPGFENEYAETIASCLMYARNTQHLQFSVVGPVNEPDNTYAGIHLSGSAQCVTVMHDLGLQLDANGMSDVRFSGPDLAYIETSWLTAMMGDPYLMSKMAHYGLHSYQNLSYNSTGVYNLIQQSAYPNVPFWMTEFNVWCSTCSNGGPPNNTWAFARGTATWLLNHLANGASAGIVWEGYDSEYVDFNASTGGNNPPHWSYWGIFAVSNINAVVKTYTPRKGFYTLAQISKYVRPGAQRIDVSGTGSPLTVLAFYNTNNGQFTLTGANTNSSSSSLSCVLASLPAIPSLDLYYTSSSANLAYGAHVTVNNGAFSVVVPADCVFTLTYTNTGAALSAQAAPLALASPPTLTCARVQGQLDLALAGQAGQRYVIEASGDLVNWSELATVTNQNGTVRVSPPMTANRQFYRARLLP